MSQMDNPTKTSLSIKLIEPVIFLRPDRYAHQFRPVSNTGSRANRTDEEAPAVVRGTLVMALSKPTKVSKICMTMEGTCRSEWYEGTGYSGILIPCVENRSVLLRTRATIFDATLPEHQGTADNEFGPFLLSQPSPAYSPPTAPHRPTFENITEPITSIPSRATQVSTESSVREPPFFRRARGQSFTFGTGSGSKISLLSDTASVVERGKEGWKIFPKGTYIYHFSFLIPSTLPPSMNFPHGYVKYTLSAIASRPGSFISDLCTSQDLNLVSYPRYDVEEEGESDLGAILQREWEDQLSISVELCPRKVEVGGKVYCKFMLTLLSGVRVLGIGAYVEERVEYLSHFKRVVERELPKVIELWSVGDVPKLGTVHWWQNDQYHHGSPVITSPTQTDPPGAAPRVSPALTKYIIPGSPDSPTLTFENTLILPGCEGLSFSHRNGNSKHRSNIEVHHRLKFVFRVERGDDKEVDMFGRRKRYDIPLALELGVLSCWAKWNLMELPCYSPITPYSSPDGQFPTVKDKNLPLCPCPHDRKPHRRPSFNTLSLASLVPPPYPPIPVPNAPPASAGSSAGSSSTQGSTPRTPHHHRPFIPNLWIPHRPQLNPNLHETNGSTSNANSNSISAPGASTPPNNSRRRLDTTPQSPIQVVEEVQGSLEAKISAR